MRLRQFNRLRVLPDLTNVRAPTVAGWLISTPLRDESVTIYIFLWQNKRLRVLNVSHNQLERLSWDDASGNVQHLRQLPTLRLLNAGHNQLVDPDADSWKGCVAVRANVSVANCRIFTCVCNSYLILFDQA